MSWLLRKAEPEGRKQDESQTESELTFHEVSLITCDDDDAETAPDHFVNFCPLETENTWSCIYLGRAGARFVVQNIWTKYIILSHFTFGTRLLLESHC